MKKKQFGKKTVWKKTFWKMRFGKIGFGKIYFWKNYFGKINLGKLNFGQIHFVVKGSAGTSPTTLTTGSHESDKNGIIFAVVTLHVHQMHLQSTCPILNYGCKVTQLLFAWYFCNVCFQM